MKLTEAQKRELKRIERRDWPAGEPRRGWVHKSALAFLERHKLVEGRFPDILHLTDKGRAALSDGGANG